MRLIFDLDGTLADTAKATIPVCAEVSARHGLPPLSDDDIRAAIGYANPEFYYRLYPQYAGERVDAFGAAVEHAETEMVHRLGPDILFPGVLEMLQTLHGMRVPLYIASTGDAAHVDAVLQSAGIAPLFFGIRCGLPEKVRMVGEILGAENPCHWAMVGDREKDLDAARGNGMTAIAAGYGYCTGKDGARFDWVAHTPQELIEWVRTRLHLA